MPESSFNQQIIWWHWFTITHQWKLSHHIWSALWCSHSSVRLLRHPGHHMIVKGIWPDLHWVGQEARHQPQQAQQAGLWGPQSTIHLIGLQESQQQAETSRHRLQTPLLYPSHELQTAWQVFLELLYLWWELSSHHIPASKTSKTALWQHWPLHHGRLLNGKCSKQDIFFLQNYHFFIFWYYK